MTARDSTAATRTAAAPGTNEQPTVHSAARPLLLAGLLTTATLALTGALGTAEAVAAAPKEYVATADLNGRSGPEFGGRVVVDFVKKGQTVELGCQTYGEEAYGSRLWDLVAVDDDAPAMFVPDRFIKTGTDGRVPGVPDCSPNVQPARGG